MILYGEFARLLRTLSTLDQQSELCREDVVIFGHYLTTLWHTGNANSDIDLGLIERGLKNLRKLAIIDYVTAQKLHDMSLEKNKLKIA